MPTPQQVRAALPALSTLDDDQLVDAVHQLYFGNETRDQVAARMGVAPPPAPPTPSPGLGGRAKDLGISLLKGAVDIPEAAVGLADIPTGGRVGKFLANDGGAVGFRPAEAKAFLDNGYSEAQKQAFQAVNDARGFGDTAAAVATHPSTVIQSAAESLPSMLAGGAVSRAALKVLPALSGATAGAIGEGTVAAGQQVEQTREDTPDGLLTPTQVALTAGSGLIDAALAFGGGKLAHAAGATNVATWLSGKSDTVPGVSKLRAVLAGGGEEGMQEFLQSAQEQVLQNKAEGKPLDDGLDQAAILGLTTGAAMGAGANLMHSAAHGAAPVVDPTTGQPVAPPVVDPTTGQPAAPPVVAPPPISPGDALRASAPPVEGPTSRAANVAIETGAQQLDANPDAHAAPAGPVPMLPDVDPAHVQGVLDHANARSAQLDEAAGGTPEQVIKADTPEGADTVIPEVPGRHLTPDEKTEQEFLNQHGGDAQAVAAHYTNLIPNIQRQMTESATKMATPAELAAVQPGNPMQPGDIGPGTNAPFTTRGAALRVLSRMPDAADHSVTPVDGGHVIRPNEAPVTLPPATDETPTVTAPDGSQRATFSSQSDANKYLKQARKAQGVMGTGVKPVQLPSGTWVLATKDEQAHITALAQHVPVAPEPTSAPAAPVAPEAAPGWQAFPPESGTLGIPRSEMPQVAAEHRGALVNFLKARGVTADPAAPVDARTLKATQAEFSPEKVQRARDFTGGNRSILVSSDGHVVDGHHQAIAADQGPISAIRLNAPIRDLLPLVHEFPSSTRDGVAPDPAAVAAARAPVSDATLHDDPLLAQAQVHVEAGVTAPRALARKMQIGYNRAARLIEQMNEIKKRGLDVDPPDAPVSFDRTRTGSAAVMDKLAAQGYEHVDAPKVRVAERLNKLMEQINSGEITEKVFVDAVDQLARESSAASNTKQANRMTGERERGPDIVREKIIAAMRRGDIDRETGEFAQWLVNRDPHLTEGLGISVRTAGAANAGSAGQYNGAARIMTLFKGGTNDGTAVHEILHHTERMMPAGIQDGIHKEWSKQLAAQIAAAEPGSKRAIALGAILEAVANPSEARQQAVHDAFAANGPLDYDKDYQLVNPSEFWAVNATRLLQGQFHSQTWLGKAKAWLSSMVQRVKSILGLQSDHPVLRGLQAVIDGDGSDQSRRMLSEQATHLANQPAVDGGRRNALRVLAGSASVATGLRGLSLLNVPNGAEDVALVKAMGTPTPPRAPAPPGPAASTVVLHDLQRPKLDAIAAVSLPLGYKIGDLMGNTPGKISVWHKTVGTPFNLAEKSPAFKKVFDSIQSFINDISHYTSEAANLAPTLLPQLNEWRDAFGKSAISVADRDAISAPIFGAEEWMRDTNGGLTKLTESQRSAVTEHETASAAVEARNSARAAQYAHYTTEQKRDHLLQNRLVTPEVMRMWEGRPVDEHAKMVDTAFSKGIAEAAPVAPDGVKSGTVFSDDELREHFKLTDAQVGMYHEFRDAVGKSLDQIHAVQMLRLAGDDLTPEIRAQVMAAPTARDAAKIAGDHLRQVAADSPARADSLNATAESVDKLGQRATDLKEKGYAPYMRFGTYVLDVTDPKSGERQFFSLYESPAELKRATRQLRKSGQFDGSKFEQGTTSQEKYKLFAQMSPDTVSLFGDMIGLSSTGDDAKDVAFQEFLKRAKSATSAMKHLIHRAGVAGYSLDAGRVLAGFTYSNGRLASNGLHSGETERHFNAIPKGEGQLIDQAYKLMTYVQNPQEDGAKIKGLLFAQYLGGSIASALVNATQPFMTTMPFLSQHGGITNAAKHMGEALPLIKAIAKTGKTGNAALDAAMETHAPIIAPQEVHQLMAQAQGRAALHSGDGTRAGNAAAAAHNVMSRIGMAWGKVFGVAEQFNRRLTFIAAFNQAVEHGLADPGAYAEKAVQSTQFIMNKGNKPVAGRGAVGGVLMTFKQYTISYLEMMQRLATQGAPGSPERASGRKAFMYAIGAMMMMAGADGLPFIEDVDDVIDGALQRLGYNFHSKQQREAWLKNLFGEDMGNFVAKGITGLPGAPLDVSGRLGMANVIPGTGLLVDKVDHTSDLAELAGPAGDVAKRAFAGAGQLVRGDVAGAVTSVLPKAASNMVQAASMWNSGEYKDANGKKIVDTDFTDALLKFVGFQPKDVSDVQSNAYDVMQTVAENRLKQTQITQALAIGISNKDPGARDAAIADLADWNAKNPDTKINRSTVINGAQKMAKTMGLTKDQRVIKATPQGMRAQVRERLAEGQ